MPKAAERLAVLVGVARHAPAGADEHGRRLLARAGGPRPGRTRARCRVPSKEVIESSRLRLRARGKRERQRPSERRDQNRRRTLRTAKRHVHLPPFSRSRCLRSWRRRRGCQLRLPRRRCLTTRSSPKPKPPGAGGGLFHGLQRRCAATVYKGVTACQPYGENFCPSVGDSAIIGAWRRATGTETAVAERLRRATARREREREIVEATRALFDERGVQDAPMEEIARAVGINKALSTGTSPPRRSSSC